MSGHTTICLLLWVAVAVSTVRAQNDVFSPIYVNNIEFLVDSSNVVNISFPALQTALKKPNSTNETSFAGYDWTKPFPSSKIDGHGAHLRVAYDVPIPETVVQNSTTA